MIERCALGPLRRKRLSVGIARHACDSPTMPAEISSLADLARIAYVSISTVSRSLDGSPGIAKGTRARVLELARQHGFQPNRAARNFRLKRTGAIGVVLPLGHEADQHLSDPFFMSLIGPLADRLTERGYDMLLSRVIPRDGRWLSALADSGRVDGIIVIGQSDQIDAIEAVARDYPALVVWGSIEPGRTQVAVGSDNEAGGHLAAAHLLGRGRRRLAFFGNADVPEFAARYAGFKAATDAAGVVGDLLSTHLTAEASHAAIANFLSRNPPPDGIVAASDVIAMSALRVLVERGVRVPQDVSVVGYDDVSLARFTSPPLATLRQDLARGAPLLGALLFGRIEGEEVAPVAMKPELVLRASA